MTRDEMNQLEKLGERIDNLAAKVETYHVENREQIASCNACRATVEGMGKIVWGNGEPGLKGDVQSLKESRGHLRAGMWALWSAAVAITAAVVKLFVS